MNTTPKMRLIREVFDELHQIDPNSAITMYALRQLVRSGKIPSVNVGRKILVNYTHDSRGNGYTDSFKQIGTCTNFYYAQYLYPCSKIP